MAPFLSRRASITIEPFRRAASDPERPIQFSVSPESMITKTWQQHKNSHCSHEALWYHAKDMEGNTHFFTVFAKIPERLKFLGKLPGFKDDLIISIKIAKRSFQEMQLNLGAPVYVTFKSSSIEAF
jgi:hypothetical protein